MLEITITPTALHFPSLSDEVYNKLRAEYVLVESKKGYAITGSPHELFKVLLALSYTYDIELS